MNGKTEAFWLSLPLGLEIDINPLVSPQAKERKGEVRRENDWGKEPDQESNIAASTTSDFQPHLSDAPFPESIRQRDAWK